MENKVTVTFNGADHDFDFDQLGVSMESSDAAVLAAVRPAVIEASGVDVNDESGQVAFAVDRALNTGIIHVYPKPIAG